MTRGFEPTCSCGSVTFLTHKFVLRSARWQFPCRTARIQSARRELSPNDVGRSAVQHPPSAVPGYLGRSRRVSGNARPLSLTAAVSSASSMCRSSHPCTSLRPMAAERGGHPAGSPWWPPAGRSRWPPLDITSRRRWESPIQPCPASPHPVHSLGARRRHPGAREPANPWAGDP